MTCRRIVTLMVAAAVIVACLGSPAVAGRKKKEEKKAGISIPAHPSELKFGKLEFEVPDAAKYRHELSNGIPVFIGEDHSLPLIDLKIRVRSGSFLEQVDSTLRTGVAGMTGALLRQGGAGEKSAEEFDEAVSFMGTNISSFGGDTSSVANLNCTTMVLDQSLDLFFEMLRNPRFEQERIDIHKDALLEEMKQRNDDARGITAREWQWLFRGQDHYSSAVMTASNLSALTREDLVAFHKNYWQPGNMMISVSGDVNPEQILKELETRFAGWDASGSDVPWPPPAPEFTPTPGVYHVQKDIPQGRVRIGHPGVQRADWADPDLFALQVMNDILGGGGFTSRLVKRIRSDEGLAYSAGSRFGIGDWSPGIFMMLYQSKSSTVAFAAQIALEEMKKIATEQVTPAELATAKASFVDTFPGRFDSVGVIVGTLLDDEYKGRPGDYWKKYQSRMAAVSVEDVQRVAKKYLHPDNLVFLIVGNWEDIVPGDADGRASMKEFHDGQSIALPLRDPLTLEPIK